MAVLGRRDSATRAVGDTATAGASQAATIIVTARAVVVGERGHHGSLIEPARAATATQPPSPSEVHALGRVTEEEDGVRRARTRSSSDLGDLPARSKKCP